MAMNLLRILQVFVFTFAFQFGLSATHAAPKSSSLLSRLCDLTLTKSFRPTIDEQEFRKSLRALGYPESQIDVKLNALNAPISEYMLETIRDATGNRKWQFGDAFPDDDYNSLARIVKIHIERIGYWASVPNLSFGRLVLEVVEKAGLFSEQWFYETRKFKALFYWSHLWLNGEHGVAIAKALWRKTLNPAVIGLSLKGSSLAQRDVLKSAYREILAKENPEWMVYRADRYRFLLLAAHFIPEDIMPVELRRSVYDRWVNERHHPPIQLPALSACVHGGGELVGSCQDMAAYHLATLEMDGGAGGRMSAGVLIWLNGQLIGSLKTSGDRSMIALRNVVDSEGKLLLAMGGVYALPKVITDSVSSHDVKRAHLKFEDLQASPVSFVFNQEAWYRGNHTALAHLFAGQFSRKDISSMFDYGDKIEDHQKQEIAMWQALLRELESVRIELEASTKK